ncbi:hypothetical protein LCGC14_2593940 [marine sediment metagenome]|uniref:Uncharacterized protein n=1 Tax=marine sediment metagenome TaxID=412755 RepID=A0A0F9CLT6_9ZZZZ
MPYFDRFDIVEAYYLFARHYHSGGDTSDGIFKRIHRLRFKPGLSLCQHDDPSKALTENGAEIYAQLEANHPDAKGC